MRNYRIIFLFILLCFLSCSMSGQYPDNTKPMYGEVKKSEEYIKSDEEFIKESINKFGTIDSSINVYIDIAWKYFYHNDLNTAMKRFNQVWLLNNEFPDSYFGFAALLEMQGNKTESQRFYKLGIEKDKTKERIQDCYQLIADCKQQLKDFNGTIEVYKKILEFNPNYVFAFKKIGYLQMQNSNFEEALIALTKAIELDTTDAITYSNRAFLYQTNQNYLNAIADYTKAIKLDPNYIRAYVNRGLSSIELKKYKSAKNDFEICIQLDSNSGELRRILGLSKIYLNDIEGACKDMKLANKLGDKQAEELMRQICK